jgi:sugar lactone lactonase YvrE
VYFVDGLGYAGTPARTNSVFRIDPGGSVTRIAGNSRTGFSGDGGSGTGAALNYPVAVAADRTGNVFIVDAGNQRVRRVSPDGTITTVAGGGSAVLGDGGPALSGQLNYPSSIAVDGAGNLFIGELGRVRKVTPDGTITTVAGGGLNNPTDGAPATTVQLTNAIGLAVDAAGNLFIADEDLNDDSFNFFIRKVSPDGIISTLPPVANCCYANIAADSAGNLLISTGSRILRISPGGSQTVVAGNGTYGLSSGDGLPATQAQLNGPSAVAVDSAGDVLIADNIGRNVRIVTPDGIIRSLASIPGSTPPPNGDRGPAVMANLQLAVAGLSDQSGLAVDSAGNLYIAETGAHRVRKVATDGTITTVAGVGGPRCTDQSTCLPLGDGGPATGAALSYPTSVAVDAAGNLFIADSGNSRVRKVASDGTISTYAGNGNAPGWPPGSGDGGLATSAPLLVLGVAVDSAGNLLISEGNYADVRRVAPDGTISTLLYPTGLSYLGSLTAMTIDHAGNLFVAGSVCDSDTCYFGVRKVSPSGETTVIAGSGKAYNLQPGSSIGDGGPAIDAAIGFISCLVVDTSGNLFLADLFAQRVRKIDPNGIITTVGGNGIPGYSGDGGPATNASVLYPLGLAADARGNVYLSDFNQAVRILRPAAQ